jgi:peptide/nickel transport system substrate-binding protein
MPSSSRSGSIKAPHPERLNKQTINRNLFIKVIEMNLPEHFSPLSLGPVVYLRGIILPMLISHSNGVKVRIAILIAAFVSLLACSRPNQEERVLRVAFPSTVKSLDPYSEATQISGSIFSRVFSGLTMLSADLAVQPSVALRWSNPDERTYIFELRRDVKFDDGTPLTAEDIKFSFEKLKELPNAPQASTLAALQRVDVLDPHTVRMVMHQPTTNFVRRLFAIAIVSRKSYKPNATENNPGSGAYRIKSWKSGEYVQLEASSTFWGSPPGVREIRFEAIPDADVAVKRLIDGSIDVIPLLNPDSAERFKLNEQKDVIVKNIPGLLVIYLGFDFMHDVLPGSTLSKNPFRDLRVRKAVYQAINTERLTRSILKGYADEATQLVAPLIYGYNPEIKRLPFDPAAARKLLAEAGYPEGFSVRLDAPNNRYRSDVKIANAVVEDLRAVGIRAELNAQSIDQWMKIRMQHQTPFYMAGWMVTSGDASGALDFIVHTPDEAYSYGRTNSGGYSNPGIDDLIKKASSTMDPKERVMLLESAIEQAMSDVAIVPLYIERNLSAHRSDIEWSPRADGLLDATTFSFKAHRDARVPRASPEGR